MAQMVRRGNAVALAFLLMTTALASAGLTQATPSSLIVHEWGTFTSVAGQDGQAVEWQPLSGPSDLPCFVRVLNPTGLKVISGTSVLPTLRATVRMETPVLYFYSPEAVTARVQVRFPRGVITEWYPQAVVPQPWFPISEGTGAINWTRVVVNPGATAAFPTEPGPSHYYAARETDAAPVVVDGQTEKFLFYRGLASFPVPIRATVEANGQIAVTNAGRHDLGRLILFENRAGRIGYRVVDAVAPTNRVLLTPPALNSSFAALRADLERTLVETGLYPREAAAMVETWRDSWFETGLRLFYIVPPAAVDEILPLTINPKPASVARAFVGRLELITPAVEADVELAIRTNDLKRLLNYGRFLEPIAERCIRRARTQADVLQIREALRLVAASRVPEAPCR